MVDDHGDAYVQPMNADEITTTTRHPIVRFLTAPFSARTWKETLYLLLSLPIGVVTFSVLIAGLTTGASLLIIMVGFAVIWVTFVLARVFADLERIRARALLDADVARLYLPDERGWCKRLKSRAEDPSTWLDVVYGILLLPVGVFTFTISLTVWASGLALVALPAYYWALPKQATTRGTSIVFAWTNGHPWVVDTGLEVALSVLLGVVVVLVAPWITRAMALASRGLVQAMLGGGASKQLSKRVRELTTRGLRPSTSPPPIGARSSETCMTACSSGWSRSPWTWAGRRRSSIAIRRVRRSCWMRRTRRRSWRSAMCATWREGSTRPSSPTAGWTPRSQRSPRGARSPSTSPWPWIGARPHRSRRPPTSWSPRRSPTSPNTPVPHARA
jgi:hypothetical protein